MWFRVSYLLSKIMSILFHNFVWQSSRRDARWGGFIIRAGIVLSVMVPIISLRFSTGSPTFKPVDNAASFDESAITRVRQNMSY